MQTLLCIGQVSLLHYLNSKVSAIPLRNAVIQTLVENGVRRIAVQDFLSAVQDVHTILLQFPLVVLLVIPISCKAVVCIDNHIAECAGLTVLNHSQKVLAVCIGACHRLIDVLTYDLKLHPLGILFAVLNLLLCTNFSLVIATVSSIQYTLDFLHVRCSFLMLHCQYLLRLHLLPTDDK